MLQPIDSFGNLVFAFACYNSSSSEQSAICKTCMVLVDHHVVVLNRCGTQQHPFGTMVPLLSSTSTCSGALIISVILFRTETFDILRTEAFVAHSHCKFNLWFLCKFISFRNFLIFRNCFVF